MHWTIEDEFIGAEFGDERLSRRLTTIAKRLVRAPGASIPKAVETSSELEGTYRFLRHESVVPGEILRPHVEATCRRAEALKQVIVAHDTSHFCFPTPRAGLGRGTNGEVARVFFGHVALAVTADVTRQAIGVLGAEAYVRTGPPRRKKTRHSEKRPEGLRESTRWWRTVAQVEAQLDGCAQAIHVMDREADQYLLFARLTEMHYRFVVRLRHDRHIVLKGHRGATVRHALASLEGIFSRDVDLSAKDPKPMAKRRGLKRQTRQAKLEFRATPITLSQPTTVPKTRKALPQTLTVNVVHVVERNAPEGYQPIDWKLVTTEPIETTSDIEAIVDAYRTRWVIEEYFKALKTGCALEKRQLETATTIFNALAVFIPIAWHLLRLRHLAREQSKTPAGQVLNSLQIKLLQSHPDVKLTPDPTVYDAAIAIARLGGHIKQNGPPGWIVLGRGYEDLLRMELGAQLMNQPTQTYDLS